MTLAESTAIPEFVRVALKARMQCLALNSNIWVCGDCVCVSLCVLACKAYIVDSIRGSWALSRTDATSLCGGGAVDASGPTRSAPTCAAVGSSSRSCKRASPKYCLCCAAQSSCNHAGPRYVCCATCSCSHAGFRHLVCFSHAASATMHASPGSPCAVLQAAAAAAAAMQVPGTSCTAAMRQIPRVLSHRQQQQQQPCRFQVPPCAGTPCPVPQAATAAMQAPKAPISKGARYPVCYLTSSHTGSRCFVCCATHRRAGTAAMQAQVPRLLPQVFRVLRHTQQLQQRRCRPQILYVSPVCCATRSSTLCAVPQAATAAMQAPPHAAVAAMQAPGTPPAAQATTAATQVSAPNAVAALPVRITRCSCSPATPINPVRSAGASKTCAIAARCRGAKSSCHTLW